MMFSFRWLLAATAMFPSVTWAQPAGTAPAPPPPPPPAFKVGQQAPDFTLPYLAPKADGGYEVRQVSLSQFRGKQNVVLAFFPAAFSPG